MFAYSTNTCGSGSTGQEGVNKIFYKLITKSILIGFAREDSFLSIGISLPKWGEAYKKEETLNIKCCGHKFIHKKGRLFFIVEGLCGVIEYTMHLK